MPPPPLRSQSDDRSRGSSPNAKASLIASNSARLLEDLWSGRLEFSSRPRVVDLQLSNICNMSCTMCYDGVNPPAVQMPEDKLREVAPALFPTATSIVPFSGSEPLIVTWDMTKELAESYGLDLDIITNAQFLDEEMFAALEPHVSSLTFSIDSHIPEIYERIRLRSKPKKVFENLERAVRQCREHGIEPQANVVVLVENAPWLDETTAYFADLGIATVRFLQYEHPTSAPPDRSFSDGLRRFTPEWIEWMKEKIRRVAREKRIRVVFDFAEKEIVDFLPSDIVFREDPKPQPLLDRLVRFFPGYCWQSVDRVKLMADGATYPCCKGDTGELLLGNTFASGFEAVWNGPEAQDLRRGMLTWDLPRMCRGCSFHTGFIRQELAHLPFHDWVHDERLPGLPRNPDGHVLEILGPEHMLRSADAPRFHWTAPNAKVDRYLLAIALGGEFHPDNRTFEIPGEATEFSIGEEEWTKLRPNIGWWWSLWALDASAPDKFLRSRTARCVVRHEPIPRVPGSRLYDAD